MNEVYDKSGKIIRLITDKQYLIYSGNRKNSAKCVFLGISTNVFGHVRYKFLKLYNKEVITITLRRKDELYISNHYTIEMPGINRLILVKR